MAKQMIGFNDPIHGYMEFEPLLVDIIHTPQFQRMKDIKQLGAAYWVYPGASHNRFEHSLGTAYLAGKMIEALRDNHEDKNIITDEEVLCVKIAALCHDLGHGPFSHVFDKQMKTKLIKYHQDRGSAQVDMEKLKTWEHEDASCDMFDYMLDNNANIGTKIGENRQLIKDLIKGKPHQINNVPQIPAVKGHQKGFLFEIVANKSNEIDCDKFDYFARDCLNLGVKSNFDHLRYIHNIRILLVDGVYRLCVRDKLVFNIYELFHTRWSLHHRVYQHKTTKAIEDMITDAFIQLENVKYKFSEALFNMEEYVKLTDSIFYEIIHGRIDHAQTDGDQGQPSGDHGQPSGDQAQLQPGGDHGQPSGDQAQLQPDRDHGQPSGDQAQLQPGGDHGQPSGDQAQWQPGGDHGQPSGDQAQLLPGGLQGQSGGDQGQVSGEQGKLGGNQDQSSEDTKRMKKAQDILRRIQERNLYKLCRQIQPSQKLDCNVFTVADEISSLDEQLSSDDLSVCIVNINFGMKDNDPVKSVPFYDKTFNILQISKNGVSSMLPQKFSEQYVRVYAKNPDKEATIVKCFREWCEKNQFPIPDHHSGDETPKKE